MKTVCDHCGEFVDLVDTPENVKLQRVELAWAIQCRNNENLKAEVERLRGLLLKAHSAACRPTFCLLKDDDCGTIRTALGLPQPDDAYPQPAAEAEKGKP